MGGVWGGEKGEVEEELMGEGRGDLGWDREFGRKKVWE